MARNPFGGRYGERRSEGSFSLFPFKNSSNTNGGRATVELGGRVYLMTVVVGSYNTRRDGSGKEVNGFVKIRDLGTQRGGGGYGVGYGRGSYGGGR
jgi:hypothetical protein